MFSCLFRAYGRISPSLAVVSSLLVCSAALTPGLAAQAAHLSYAMRTLGGGFSGPYGVAVDPGGNVYVADTAHNAVKKMPAGCASSSCVTNVGGGFPLPQGIAVDGGGNVYVADTGNNAVKMAPAGCTSSSCVTTLGGGFSLPAGVAVDPSHNVYVADSGNNAVKMIPAGCVTSACVTTLGGGFAAPAGVAVNSGNVYVADSNNNAVKEMPTACASSTCVTTLGGGFSSPAGVVVDRSGNIFVADRNNNAVEEMPAGCASASCVTPVGDGFSSPEGVAVHGDGNVYVADSSNNLVKEVMLKGVDFLSRSVGAGATAPLRLTFAFDAPSQIQAPAVRTQGTAGLDFADAGTGTCTTNSRTHYYNPGDTCTVDVTFAPKFPGTRNGAVVLNAPSGTTIATAYIYGTGIGPQVAYSAFTVSGTLSGFSTPSGMAVDGGGNIWVADSGDDAGNQGGLSVIPAGCASSSCVQKFAKTFVHPNGVAVDGAGNVYVNAADNGGAFKIPPGCTQDSCVTRLTTNVGGVPAGPAVDSDGNVYVVVGSTSAGEIWKMPPGCTSSACATTLADLAYDILAITADSNGNVYAGWSGTVSEIPAGCTSSSCMIPMGGGFSYPVGLAVDGEGNIYVADWSSTFKEMAPGCHSSACVKTLDGGFPNVAGVAVANNGNVYEGYFFAKYVTQYQFQEDIGSIKEIDRGSPRALNFATTEAGSTSADSPRKMAVLNIGNADLNISDVTYAKDFPEAAGQPNDCASPRTLHPNQSCALSIDFSPLPSSITGPSTVLSESVSVTDNNLNLSAQVQSVAVSGTETFTPPALTSPAPGSTLGGSSQTFMWSQGTSTTAYKLNIGTLGVGSANIYTSGVLTATSASVSNIPTNGVNLYVRLLYQAFGVWKYIDYLYTELGTPQPPSLTSPTPGSKLAGSTQTFTWNPGAGATAFQLNLGTLGPGSGDVYKSGWLTASSASVSGIPANGVYLYVRLMYRMNGVWKNLDYVYIESGVAKVPLITSPLPGSTLSGSTQTFTWTKATATSFRLRVGTTLGADNLWDTGVTTATSVNVTHLPTAGAPLYARLWYNLNGTWSYTDYQYTEF